MYKWPPKMPHLGDEVKRYIDKGLPLSISDTSGPPSGGPFISAFFPPAIEQTHALRGFQPSTVIA